MLYDAMWGFLIGIALWCVLVGRDPRPPSVREFSRYRGALQKAVRPPR